ncbi:MAG: glycosyltransferase family 4 protein [Fibrobacterota bacterium]|nr:glycosyltransferase family 4 protein [Fibrobacterota bacterium]
MAISRIRVCVNALLVPPTFGGIGNVAYHVLRELVVAHPGWEFTLLVSGATAPHFRGLAGVRIKEVGIASRLGRLAYLHFFFPFLAARFDVVHSVGNMGLVACPAAQVITIHDAYEHVSPERFGTVKRTLMRLLISVSGRRAKRIIAVSDNTRMDLERFYPHFRGKISVVHSGNKFPLRVDASPDGRNGFLFVGTLEPGKNLPLVLQAFARFRKGQAGVLRIAGAKGWKQSILPGLIAELGISADVEFLGFVPDELLMAEYGRSLALVQASSYEGFGLPVIEAMACGCPVIAARNSGLIEAGGDAALFFETGRADELALLMARVHGERNLREACIRKGLAHAARFTWGGTAENVGKIFAAAHSAGRDKS